MQTSAQADAFANQDRSRNAPPILPGSWLGVLGGGQLGRMFAQAAQRMGYHVAVFESEANSPAAQVAERCFVPGTGVSTEPLGLATEPLGLEAAVVGLSQLCQATTLEFENIPASLVRLASEYCRMHPGVRFLEVCQDRVQEKQAVSGLGCPTTPYHPVTDYAAAQKAIELLGLPMVIKTARSGYDGKGQLVVRTLEELPAVWQKLGSDHLIAEQWIEHVAELSIITARNLRGEVVHYPLFENQHAHHILDVTQCPVRNELRQFQSQAEEISRTVAEAFGVVGLFCIEFFVTRDGRLLVNEIAPRPHNSGHLTIEAFDISQFEMQVRAICNLPLRSPVPYGPAAMANLLGELWSDGIPNWSAVLQRPQTYLHLYGKSTARPGRKMGHVTVVGLGNADRLVRDARKSLQSLPTSQPSGSSS